MLLRCAISAGNDVARLVYLGGVNQGRSRLAWGGGEGLVADPGEVLNHNLIWR